MWPCKWRYAQESSTPIAERIVLQTEPTKGALWQRESIGKRLGTGLPNFVHLETQIRQLATAQCRCEMCGPLVPYGIAKEPQGGERMVATQAGGQMANALPGCIGRG